MTRDTALALNSLFLNPNGYIALQKFIEERIESIKKELLSAPLDEVVGLQRSASELKRLLSLREQVKQTLEDGNGKREI